MNAQTIDPDWTLIELRDGDGDTRTVIVKDPSITAWIQSPIVNDPGKQWATEALPGHVPPFGHETVSSIDDRLLMVALDDTIDHDRVQHDVTEAEYRAFVDAAPDRVLRGPIY